VDIGERRQANILVLAPVGRIDNLTSGEFQTRLLAAVTSSSADVVIDFSGVEYISSAGLCALMTASRQKPKSAAGGGVSTVVHETTISRFSSHPDSRRSRKPPPGNAGKPQPPPPMRAPSQSFARVWGTRICCWRRCVSRRCAEDP
jgi:anti-anti-sigma factor